ncbi:MAG TPA: hypothetical protein VL495_01225 [Edaphobacter sp.]|jgi:hypothetical protein|nr:hypothetical protein [Edaphobacter sp.]
MPPSLRWSWNKAVAAARQGEDSLVWPMVPGVAAAAFVLWMICSWLRPGTFPAIGLVVAAGCLLLLGVVASAFVAQIIYAKSSGENAKATPVVQAACLAALWVPAWILFMLSQSPLMVLAGCLCLATVGFFLKRCSVEAAAPVNPQPAPESEASLRLAQLTEVARGPKVLPSFLLALLAEVAIVLVITQWYKTASLAWGVWVAILCWRAVPSQAQPQSLLSSDMQQRLAACAYVLTLVALLPYLKVSPGFRGGLAALLKPNHTVKENDAARENSSRSSAGYVGIVLLSPSVKQRKLEMPAKHDPMNFSVRLAQPLEIPFDGQYWYFKAPDRQPRPTAHVVRADTLKATIQSSDSYPLLMEAHQRLSDPMDLGCCSAIHMVVQNADKREGRIALELWVRNRTVKPVVPHYLGTATIPSSELPTAAKSWPARPPEENMSFPIPPGLAGLQFDEIMLVVRSSPALARTGAKIAIRKFVFEP